MNACLQAPARETRHQGPRLLTTFPPEESGTGEGERHGSWSGVPFARGHQEVSAPHERHSAPRASVLENAAKVLPSHKR